jgi:hypothetical protein
MKKATKNTFHVENGRVRWYRQNQNLHYGNIVDVKKNVQSWDEAIALAREETAKTGIPHSATERGGDRRPGSKGPLLRHEIPDLAINES